MSFTVDQSPGAGDGDVIRRLLIQFDGEELPQRERIGQAPSDAALAVEAFEETDHHDTEILARRKGWTAELLVIEVGTAGFAEGVELGLVENFVEPLIERMAGRCGQLAAVPKVRLTFSHLPGAHCHSLSVRPKHFNCYMFRDFRHGLLSPAMIPSRAMAACSQLVLTSVWTLGPDAPGIDICASRVGSLALAVWALRTAIASIIADE